MIRKLFNFFSDKGIIVNQINKKGDQIGGWPEKWKTFIYSVRIYFDIK